MNSIINIELKDLGFFENQNILLKFCDKIIKNISKQQMYEKFITVYSITMFINDN